MLLNDARLAAPELTIDTILTLIESKKIKEAQWRRELLEEALRLTDDVKYPVRKERAYFGTLIVDTVSGYMTYAYQQKLDGLSLKARIIKAWLAVDKERTRQLLFQIRGDLKLKPVTCEDAMSYQVADIYQTVGETAKLGFTVKEIAEGIRGLFILPWVENIESPTQILPVMVLLKGLESPPVERRLLINAFERAIDRNFNDDRSFTRIFRWNASEAATLMRDAPERIELTRAWRDMMAKNTTTLRRCLGSQPEKKGELPQPIQYFNALFSEDQRFSDQDFARVEYKGEPLDKLYVDTPNYKKFSLAYKTAREKKNLPENKKDPSAQFEWQLKVTDLLEELELWRSGAGETEIEVFNQKTIWYEDMIEQVSDLDLKVVVTRAYMRYLAASPIQKESFIEWIFHVRRFTKGNFQIFVNLAEEFPNPNFKAIVEARWIETAK